MSRLTLTLNGMHKRFRCPTNPIVSRTRPNYGASKHSYANYRPPRPRGIAYQQRQFTTRCRSVLQRPCVPKVPPDIYEPQTGDGALGVLVADLNRRIDY